MADLLSLIRLRKHTVEEKQKILSALYREAEMLATRKASMLAQVESEKKLAGDDAEAAAYFALYAENVRRKIEKIDEAIERINLRISAAQEDVRSAFAEQKKAEIIQQRRDEEEQKEIDDKETNMLNDIAIEGYRKKVKEGEDGLG